MDRWASFVDWCKKRSKLKVRTFNPKNIMVVTLSVVLISLIASGAWLYQALSVAQTVELTKYNYATLFPTLRITEDTTLTEDHHGMVVIDADGVTLDGNGHTITGPGVWMWSSTQRMWDFSTGITLYGRTGVTVKNCCVTNFSAGVFLDSCNGNMLLNNTIYNNVEWGILLSAAYNNTILDNTVYGIRDVVSNFDGAGFIVEMSFGNTFKGNVAYDNGRGFSIGEFERETFEEHFESHRGFLPEEYKGIEEYSGNIFEANTVEGNTEAGFLIGRAPSPPPYRNIFFHNNLIDNAIQAVVQLEGGYPNTWDDGYPSGGNYWSDYEGVDADGDGIGDTPYDILPVSYEWDEDDPYAAPIPILGEPDGNNMDRFPLMAPLNG